MRAFGSARRGKLKARETTECEPPPVGGSHETVQLRMPRTGKKFAAAKAKVPAGIKFAPDEALQIVRDLAFAGFDETVEIATRLGVDPKRADQIVRGTVVLPHGTGKNVRVLVAAQGGCQ